MRTPDIKYRKLVLVCINQRDNGRKSCNDNASEEFYNKLKAEMAGVDPSVRISRTGCMGNCLSGPTVVIQPDNIWLGEVKQTDIPEIKEMIMEGKPEMDITFDDLV